MYDTPQKIAKELESLQSDINDLHRLNNDKDIEAEIEVAYKAVGRAVAALEDLKIN